jgi:RNA polymerase sigma-70 factor (ECF subfamily)
MGSAPTTRPSLLVRLRDARDRAAWSQFVELYAPPVYGFARKQGLQDADAADLTQEVLRAVSAAVGRLEYDARLGSFRGWLFTVVRNKLHNFRADRRRHGQGTGDTAAHEFLAGQPSAGDDPAALWEQECERQLFAWAAEQVRGQVQPATWQAFWRTAIEGQSGQEVAAALGMSVAAVYLAKSRVMARLRERVREIEGEP